MVDGPHKTLNMPRHLKKVAEIADGKAYEQAEVTNAAQFAFTVEWNGVPHALVQGVRKILSDLQGSLFREERLDALRSSAAGHTLGLAFLDCAIHQAGSGNVGPTAFQDCIKECLENFAAASCRQIEEHYLRESTHNRAQNIRMRLEGGICGVSFLGIAESVLNSPGQKVTLMKRPRKNGLDDGPRL